MKNMLTIHWNANFRAERDSPFAVFLDGELLGAGESGGWREALRPLDFRVYLTPAEEDGGYWGPGVDPPAPDESPEDFAARTGGRVERDGDARRLVMPFEP